MNTETVAAHFTGTQLTSTVWQQSSMAGVNAAGPSRFTVWPCLQAYRAAACQRSRTARGTIQCRRSTTSCRCVYPEMTM